MALPDDFWEEPPTPQPPAAPGTTVVMDVEVGLHLFVGLPLKINGKNIGMVTGWKPSPARERTEVTCSVNCPEAIEALSNPQYFSMGCQVTRDELLAQTVPVERRPSEGEKKQRHQRSQNHE